jgi:hypothetical protein
MYTRENLPMRAKESWNSDLMRFLEQFLELVSVFKEASGNLYFFVSWTKQAKNFKTICSCTGFSYLFNFIFIGL